MIVSIEIVLIIIILLNQRFYSFYSFWIYLVDDVVYRKIVYILNMYVNKSFKSRLKIPIATIVQMEKVLKKYLHEEIIHITQQFLNFEYIYWLSVAHQTNLILAIHFDNTMSSSLCVFQIYNFDLPLADFISLLFVYRYR